MTTMLWKINFSSRERKKEKKYGDIDEVQRERKEQLLMFVPKLLMMHKIFSLNDDFIMLSNKYS